MDMPKEYDTMTWFGKGPHETYFDRKTSGVVGIYSGKVEELIHDYVRPQENANRTDVRWVSFLNDEQFGLLVVAKGDSLLNTSAWPYTQDDLEKAEHVHELPRRENITVNIDYKQRGVGGDSPVQVDVIHLHKKYKLLKKRPYRYSFILKPYSQEMGDITELVKKIK